MGEFKYPISSLAAVAPDGVNVARLRQAITDATAGTRTGAGAMGASGGRRSPSGRSATQTPV